MTIKTSKPCKKGLRKQSGYTLTELIICLIFILAMALFAGLVWVIWHFLSKVW